MAINKNDFQKWFEEFLPSSKNAMPYEMFEYDYSTTNCELCRRKKGAKRLNKNYYDENRAVEYSTGTKTVLKAMNLQTVDGYITTKFCICQSCIYRLLINQTDFIIESKRNKLRFIKKNELANHKFMHVELSDEDIVPKISRFPAGGLMTNFDFDIEYNNKQIQSFFELKLNSENLLVNELKNTKIDVSLFNIEAISDIK